MRWRDVREVLEGISMILLGWLVGLAFIGWVWVLVEQLR